MSCNLISRALLCILLSVGGWFSCAKSLGNVVINEIEYAPNTTFSDADPRSYEYIELYNTGPSAVPITGFELRDSDHVLYQFPTISLPAGAFLAVLANSAIGNVLEDTDLSDLSGRVIAGSAWGSNTGLANSGDAVQLFSSAGGPIIDFVYYDEVNIGDAVVDDAAVAEGIWKDGAAIDTLSASTTGRAIALRIDGANPNKVNPVVNAEDSDWLQYSAAIGGTPAMVNVPEASTFTLLLSAAFVALFMRVRSKHCCPK